MAERRASTAYLDELVQLFGYAELDEHAREVIESARRRAVALIDAGRGSDESNRAGLVDFAAQVLNGLWLEREWKTEDLRALIEEMADVAELPVEYVTTRVALGALTDPAVLELPPAMAIDAQLGMLSTFGPVKSVSLWTFADGGSRLSCLFHQGPSRPTRATRSLARRALGGETVDGILSAVPVMRHGEPQAALVARAAAGAREQCLVCLEEVASMIGPVLERQMLLEQGAEQERIVVQASERALMRLGFDLHDGPVQDLAAAGLELHMFRAQLARTLPGASRERELLLGRVDDIEARLAAVQSGVRALSRALDVPALAGVPLADALGQEVDLFERASGIRAELVLSGEFSSLTPSQRIALVRISHEALTNVRAHSGATRVRISVTERQSHVRARIEDDGRGFDVDRVGRAREGAGRLGLAGMRARARLLGGSCDIRSRPGGPTVVSFALPRWESPAARGGAEPPLG
jgi:signal transduction histidine kinase